MKRGRPVNTGRKLAQAPARMTNPPAWKGWRWNPAKCKRVYKVFTFAQFGAESAYAHANRFMRKGPITND